MPFGKIEIARIHFFDTSIPTMVYLRSSPFEDLADPSYASSDSLVEGDIADHDRPVWLFQDEPSNEVSNGTDWTLSTCCDTTEIIFLSLTAGYLVAIYFLWNTIVGDFARESCTLIERRRNSTLHTMS